MPCPRGGGRIGRRLASMQIAAARWRQLFPDRPQRHASSPNSGGGASTQDQGICPKQARCTRVEPVVDSAPP